MVLEREPYAHSPSRGVRGMRRIRVKKVMRRRKEKMRREKEKTMRKMRVTKVAKRIMTGW